MKARFIYADGYTVEKVLQEPPTIRMCMPAFPKDSDDLTLFKNFELQDSHNAELEYIEVPYASNCY